jgi:hypothetical protein
VPGSILAAVTPDNTPAGAVLTFAFPLGLFIVIAVILYLRFARPHRRVPAAVSGPAGPAATVPGPDTARGASVASGLPTAVGGGGAESPVEPAGGVRRAPAPDSIAPDSTAPDSTAASTDANVTGGAAPGTGPSNVSGRDGAPAGPDDSEPGTADGGKASE